MARLDLHQHQRARGVRVKEHRPRDARDDAVEHVVDRPVVPPLVRLLEPDVEVGEKGVPAVHVQLARRHPAELVRHLRRLCGEWRRRRRGDPPLERARLLWLERGIDVRNQRRPVTRLDEDKELHRLRRKVLRIDAVRDPGRRGRRRLHTENERAGEGKVADPAHEGRDEGHRTDGAARPALLQPVQEALLHDAHRRGFVSCRKERRSASRGESGTGIARSASLSKGVRCGLLAGDESLRTSRLFLLYLEFSVLCVKVAGRPAGVTISRGCKKRDAVAARRHAAHRHGRGPLQGGVARARLGG